MTACLTNPDPDPELPFQTTSVYPDPANKIGARLYRQLLQNASKMLGTRHSIVYKHVLYVNKQNHPVFYSLEPKRRQRRWCSIFHNYLHSRLLVHR